MQPFQITEINARAYYNAGDSVLKKALEGHFGKELFTASIIDRVPSVDAALAIKGVTLNEYREMYGADNDHQFAGKIVELVIEVLNEGWFPDYENQKQEKWFPVFTVKNGKLVFYNAAGWTTHVSVGSRLCYKSSDLLKHGIKILDKYYNDLLIK